MVDYFELEVMIKSLNMTVESNTFADSAGTVPL